MNTPPIVSPEEWQAAWENMLVKEKDKGTITWGRLADRLVSYSTDA